MRGANGSYLEKTLGASGDEILYFGDHTYGDILLSKKALGWRTAMLVPELDREIRVTQDHSRDFDRLSRLSAERHHLEIAPGEELALSASITLRPRSGTRMVVRAREEAMPRAR